MPADGAPGLAAGRRSSTRGCALIVTVAEQLHERGRLEGVAEGQRNILLRQLRARFGALPAEVTERVRAAETAQIELWADRVLTAPTLAAVLGDP